MQGTLKFLCTFLLWAVATVSCFAQLRLMSWNIENLGASKSREEICVIAGIVERADILAVQEVVAGPAGPEAVKRLVRELNRINDVWAYQISAPTTGSPHSSERYAFLWRKNVVGKVGKARLEQYFQQEIDREPYLGTFSYMGRKFTLVNFHATTKKRNPESEIKYFRKFGILYPEHNFIYIGDFNLPQSHPVFTPLRNMGWSPVFRKQKTSLRQKCINGDCLASEYDNVWYNHKTVLLQYSQVIHFYKVYPTVKKARFISDHIPILAVVNF